MDKNQEFKSFCVGVLIGFMLCFFLFAFKIIIVNVV